VAYSLARFVISGIPLNRHEIAPIARLGLLERVVNIPKITSWYLGELFLPRNLAPNQHWVVTSINPQDFFLPLGAAILFLVLTLLPLFLFRKQKALKPYAFFLMWFWLALSFHLHIFPLDATTSGRWFYLPMVGLLGMVGVGLQTTGVFEKNAKGVSLVFLFLVVLLSLRTVIRSFDWRNGLTLYRRDITVSKDNFNLENNLGVELFRMGEFKEAERHFENSVRLAPDWWTNWNNLAAIDEREGRLDRAEAGYKKAVENGGYYLAYENLASLYLFKQKDFQKARNFSEDSLRFLPYNPKLWFILALAEYRLGEKERALRAARTAHRLHPTAHSLFLLSRLEQNQQFELDF